MEPENRHNWNQNPSLLISGTCHTTVSSRSLDSNAKYKILWLVNWRNKEGERACFDKGCRVVCQFETN